MNSYPRLVSRTPVVTVAGLERLAVRPQRGPTERVGRHIHDRPVVLRLWQQRVGVRPTVGGDRIDENCGGDVADMKFDHFNPQTQLSLID